MERISNHLMVMGKLEYARRLQRELYRADELGFTFTHMDDIMDDYSNGPSDTKVSYDDHDICGKPLFIEPVHQQLERIKRATS